MKDSRISEKAIQTAVLDHWRHLGLPGTLVAAIPNAGALGQPGLTSGLFDLLCVGTGVAFLELKRQGRQREKNGGLSDAQVEFKRLLFDRKITHAVAYGRDEPIQILEQWGIVRKSCG